MRGANFSSTEEMQLCRSYLVIGKDAVMGTGQKTGTFWEQIEKHFNEHTGGSEGSLRSLETKWRVITADCSKFVGAMASVRALQRSGENEEVEIARGMQVHATMVDESDKENTGHKKKGKSTFKLQHCWRILETEPKWQTFRDPKPSDDDDAFHSGSAPAASAAVMHRPTGNKAEKADSKNAAVMETTYKRIASASMQTARASAKRVKLMEDANNMALFSIRLGNLDPSAQSYFKLRHALVLREMQKAAADDNASDNEDEVGIRPRETTHQTTTQVDDDDVVEVEED